MSFGNLIAFIKNDFRHYLKAGQSLKSKIGASIIVLFEPGFWSLFYYRWSHYFFKKRLAIFGLFFMRLNKFLNHVDISYECEIGQRLRLPHFCDIVIGATSVIGDDVEILNGVTLGASEVRKEGKRHPTIKNRVFIGSGAKVLGDIVINEGVSIGANAVVLKSVEANQTVVGIPARSIT